MIGPPPHSIPDSTFSVYKPIYFGVFIPPQNHPKLVHIPLTGKRLHFLNIFLNSIYVRYKPGGILESLGSCIIMLEPTCHSSSKPCGSNINQKYCNHKDYSHQLCTPSKNENVIARREMIFSHEQKNVLFFSPLSRLNYINHESTCNVYQRSLSPKLYVLKIKYHF